MKTLKAVVKSKMGKEIKQVIGEAEYPEFETVAEGIGHLGEAKVLALLNSQVKTNAMNDLRAERTGTPSTKALREEAIDALLQDGTLAALAGDKAGITAAIEKKMAELKAAAKAAAPVQESNDEDDED